MRRDSKKSGVQVISITSGKGGVGKTLTTVNLAVSAAQMGRKVLVLDADLGLANVDVVLGLSAKQSLNDVLEGHASLNEIILTGPLGIKIIPSGSGLAKMTQLSYVQRLELYEQIQALDIDYDLLLIDTGAGIAESVMHFNAIADSTIVITTPEPHAITDAYAMIKVLHENDPRHRAKLLVNMVQSKVEAERVFERIAAVAKNYLGVSLEFLGSVPRDPQVQKSVSLRQAASETSSHTVAGQAWTQIAQLLFDEQAKAAPSREEHKVWRELIWAQQEQRVVRL